MRRQAPTDSQGSPDGAPPPDREWDEIVRREGIKAALAWRDRRYDERLAGSDPNAEPQIDDSDE
jgi:hypothetical protein